MIQSVLRSLAITFIISTIIAGIFVTFEISFLKVFILATIALFIIFFMFNAIMEHKAIKNQQIIENERIKEFSKQGMELQCEYCDHSQFVPLRFDHDTKFECDQCENTNSTHIEIVVTQTTNPK